MKIDLDDSNDPGVAAAARRRSCSVPRRASTPSRSAPTTRKSSTPTVCCRSDGNKSYGLTGQYDLGGGATVNGGIASVDGFSGLDDGDTAMVGDFGISMAF